MRKIFFLVLFLLVSLRVLALNEEDQTKFGRANEAYREGRFDAARQDYEELSKEDAPQPAFFYNLANAYFREGQKGKAILNYERALLLAPRHSDIRSNLKYVNGLLEYRVEDKRNTYLKIGERLLGYFRDPEIMLLALIGYFLFLTSWLFVLFFRPGLPWGVIRKSFFVISLVLIGLAAAKKIQLHGFRDAIVLSREAEVHYGPSESDQVAFRLGEGLKIQIVQEKDNWSRIFVPNGQSGWIQKSHIEPVLILQKGSP